MKGRKETFPMCGVLLQLTNHYLLLPSSNGDAELIGTLTRR